MHAFIYVHIIHAQVNACMHEYIVYTHIIADIHNEYIQTCIDIQMQVYSCVYIVHL